MPTTKTPTIIDMLNRIIASRKSVTIETVNQLPDQANDDNLTPRYSIKDVASEDGVYLLETASSCHKVDKDGFTTTQERDEYIPLSSITKIILS